MGLQLCEKDEFALVGFACLEDVLIEQRSYRRMSRAGLGVDRGDLLFDGGDDLSVDGGCEQPTVGFGGAPPKGMDPCSTDKDRSEHEGRYGEADSDAHDLSPGCWFGAILRRVSRGRVAGHAVR